MKLSIITGLLLVGILLLNSLSHAQLKKKICFIAGKDSHRPGHHEHDAGCHLLAKRLNKNVPGVEAVVTLNGWPKDESFFDNAAAIVIFCDGGGRHVAMKHLDKLDKMAKKGVGIANLHYAVEGKPGESNDKFIELTGGAFEPHWSVNPHWKAEFKTISAHPITRGIKPFAVQDEWYFHMRFRENMKGVTPILSAVPPLSTIKRRDGAHSNNPTVRKEVKEGLPQHLAWAATRPDNGRGFGFTGGHFHENWKDDNFRKVVLNGIIWIAGIEVPENGVVSETPSEEELQEYID